MNNSTKAIPIFLMAIFMASACKKKENVKRVEKEELPVKSSTLEITPIGELNQGPASINSHADILQRSSLKMDFRSFIGLGKTQLGVDNPRYPRIKRCRMGVTSFFITTHRLKLEPHVITP